MRLYLEISTPTPSSIAARALPSSERLRFFTSRLSRLEYLSKPLAQGDAAKQALFEGAFEAPGLVSVSDELLEQAVSLRAQFGLRSTDAVHLATTIADNADVFLTGDRQLARCTDINVVPIP